MPLALRRAMEQVSTWLGQASHEGRAAVNALRTSATERNDLAAALRRAVDDCERQNAMQAELSVTGDAREMHPIVRDEVYRIAYEAIRNACAHSGGRRLDVGLSYSHDLTVRVADNGVGMAPTIAETGKSGHFGLPGMRERAERIGARLAIVSTAAGTEVVLIVPGRAIFRKPTSTIRERLAAVLTGLQFENRPPNRRGWDSEPSQVLKCSKLQNLQCRGCHECQRLDPQSASCDPDESLAFSPTLGV